MSVVHNLVPNPVPVSTTGWVQDGGCEYRLTDRGIHVTNLVSGPGNGIEYKLLTLPTGDYVYGFYSSCPDHVNGDQLSLIKSTTNATYLCVVRRTQKDGFYTASFTLPEPGCALMFVAPKQQGGAMSVSDLILTPASEWPTVQSLHESGGLPEPYFNGATCTS